MCILFYCDENLSRKSSVVLNLLQDYNELGLGLLLYYTVHVHSGKHNASVWCLSLCLSVPLTAAADAWVDREKKQA